MASAPQAATDMWNRIKGDIRETIQRLIRQDKVLNVEDGALTVQVINARGEAVGQTNIAYLANRPPQPGDAVVTAPFGGKRVAIGVIAKPGELAETQAKDVAADLGQTKEEMKQTNQEFYESLQEKATPADLDDLNAAIEDALDQKRNTADPIPQTDVTNLPQDIADILADIAARATDTDLDNLNTAIQSGLDAKRNEADPIPQGDVTGLVGDITDILADIADRATETDLNNLNSALSSAIATKRSTSVPIPQGDVSGLTSALSTVTGNVTDLQQQAEQIVFLSSQISTTSTTTATMGSFSFAASANRSYKLTASLDFNTLGEISGNFDGVAVGVDGPTGCDVDGNIGGQTVSAKGYATFAFFTDIEGGGHIDISVIVETGGSAGTVRLIWRLIDTGDTAVCLRGSSMSYRMIP